MELILAVWGAVLATVLAIRQVLSWWNERPQLLVEAHLIRTPLSDTADSPDPRRLPVTNDKGLREGISIGFSIANGGNRSLQIVGLIFESPALQLQVLPERLPAVLEPRTRVDLVIQPERVATLGKDLQDAGALDALGNKHVLSSPNLRDIMNAVEALPTRVRKYSRKEGADERLPADVEAFQAFDRSVLIRKGAPP